MDEESVVEFITNHIPELILFLGGLIAIFVVYTYLKDKDSMKYKAMMALGLLFGVLMIVMSISSYLDWSTFVLAIIVLTGFTLLIRPFRDVQIAALVSLLIMALAYLFLGDTTGTQLEFLAEGWPRIIVAVVIGAISYMILNFAESVVKLVGKILNWWPLLLILSLICIVESVLMFTGYGSLHDFIPDGISINI